MKRLLVTGGAGFIGANFAQYWHAQHAADRLVVLDALTYAGNLASLQSLQGDNRFRFVQGDIRDQRLLETLLREEGIDTIVHFAAESHVDRSILGPDSFIETNVIGTHSLLKATRAVWLADAAGIDAGRYRFHHVSTDEVYGSLGPSDPPFSELTPYAPNSPYAASKAASDHLVRAYHHTYGLPVTTSNCSNNYGPYHFPEKLIPLMIVNALEGKPLPVYGDGKNVRDWLYVEDHCRGVELVIERGRLGETYNIGGNNEHTNLGIVEVVCALLDDAFRSDASLAKRFPRAPAGQGAASKSLVTFVKDRPGHDRRYAIDARKVSNELGYAPREGLESGLRKTVRWYLDNEIWWRAVIDGSYRDWLRQQYNL